MRGLSGLAGLGIGRGCVNMIQMEYNATAKKW